MCNDSKKIIDVILKFGELMLNCGAEINRVEDTLTRLGKAYGAENMNVFAITSSLVVTACFSNGEIQTQTRRINSSASTDYTMIENLNTLSRKCCKNLMDIDLLESEIEKIKKNSSKKYKLYLGSAIASGFFAIFFGGDFFDALFSSLFGLIICFCRNKLSSLSSNKIIFNLFISFICGVGICLISKSLSLNSDKIMIGDIMLLIPGITLTNSICDMIVGDTISGVTRLIEAIIVSTALALGFALAVNLIGG